MSFPPPVTPPPFLLAPPPIPNSVRRGDPASKR